MFRETASEREGNLLDVIAPTAVLRLAAGWVRPRIVRGNAMVRSRNARAVANLGIACALTICRGAGAVQAALRDRSRLFRRRDHASGRPGDAAGIASQGQPERQELYRSARTGRRRPGS